MLLCMLPRMHAASHSHTFHHLQLLSGQAEVFGTEIVTGRVYSFTASTAPSLAVFTWHGCTVEVDGFPKGEPYVSRGDTPMVTYLNLHAALEKRRELATATGKPGPRIIIAGQASVGKSTVARLLVNYAARRLHKPLLIDLDTGDGVCCCPGPQRFASARTTKNMLSLRDFASHFTSSSSSCFLNTFSIEPSSIAFDA